MNKEQIVAKYNAVPKKKKRQFLVNFALKELGVELPSRPKAKCLICDKSSVAHGFCRKHYSSCRYHIRTYGVTREYFIKWKTQL